MIPFYRHKLPYGGPGGIRTPVQDTFLFASYSNNTYLWLRGKDSNLRLPGYEPGGLPLTYPAIIGARLPTPHRPRTELLLCPRSFLFRRASVPAFVISQVAEQALAVDPMHRASVVSSNNALQ